MLIKHMQMCLDMMSYVWTNHIFENKLCETLANEKSVIEIKRRFILHWCEVIRAYCGLAKLGEVSPGRLFDYVLLWN